MNLYLNNGQIIILEITLYAAGSYRDDYSKRLRDKADRWRDIEGERDEVVVEQILQDEIDILIDLAGHTAGNRLPVMTYKLHQFKQLI